ncbi:MAG: DUF1127 domain-containing protein [Bauldia sp.]
MSVIAGRSAFPLPAKPVSSVPGTKHTSPWRTLIDRVGAFFAAFRRRREVMSLLDMDDRMLRDIGLMRTDVTSALSGPPLADPSPQLVALATERRFAERAEMVPCRVGDTTVVELAAWPHRRFTAATAMDISNVA